jgi:23S rRNA C2498 (ribose-2'-O)-methylase RlmM
MPWFAVATPVLPDKTGTLRRFCEEMMGPRLNEFEGSRERLGITGEMAWVQHTPEGDIAIICWEVDDLERMVRNIRASDLPFDRWFVQQIKEIHGFDLIEQNPSGKPPKKLFEWKAD